MKLLQPILFLFVISLYFLLTPSVHAIYDPTTVPNNNFGMHLITPSPDESSPAADIINTTGGDWGYVVVIITESERDTTKWQQFFDDLRRRHLIPIVRIATGAERDYWTRPNESQPQAWADFLDSLNWPIKNRYVTIYNEPNHAKEWGDSTDPASYAKVLDKTIDALKAKSPDFFVLNAGLDALSPQQLPNYMDSFEYMRQMNNAVPGIFNKLDGWASHSYPNPNFSGSPTATGKGTVGSWKAELDLLRSIGVTKNLPVFIKETGWKHSGNGTAARLLSPETVADYYRRAFQESWNDPRIVAITPFVLSYQTEPFKSFSFRKIDAESPPKLSLTQTVQGAELPKFHPQYYALADLVKTKGSPIQTNTAKLTDGQIYPSIVSGEEYVLHLTFTNTGQSIWNDPNPINLRVLNDDKLDITVSPQTNTAKIEPGQTLTFYLKLKAPNSGTFNVSLNLFAGETQFDNPPFTFATQVKAPISFITKASLNWKKDPSGQYAVTIANNIQSTIKQIFIDSTGQSQSIEDRQLLPDQEYTFTIQKDHYYSKTISTTLKSGENVIDFGTLNPDIPSAILKPLELWQLLPFN
jgi:hypothetical protein